MMADPEKVWTNEEVLHEFLLTTVRYVYRTAELSLGPIREDAIDENPNRLKDRLVELQIGILSIAFGLIDGVSGPTYWPGLRLVNAETGEDLSEKMPLQSALAHVEGEYILSIEPPPDEE
jgi:hypothetical protein